MVDSESSTIGTDQRRPGPFGPACALLPKDRQPLILESATPASDAIERLVDNGFSQAPVVDKAGTITPDLR